VSVPPIPTPLDDLGRRPFSFYPPIVGIEHNEWLYQRATWSEVQVINTKTNSELWLPRRFLGAVSSIEEPIMIVGLAKELEYKGGSLIPLERRVIEMPRAAIHSPRFPGSPAEPERPAPVVGIRLEGGVTPGQAFARNVGTCRLDAKGTVQVGRPDEDQVADARHRGGAARSRVESPVMGLDRRGSGILLWQAANR